MIGGNLGWVLADFDLVAPLVMKRRQRPPSRKNRVVSWHLVVDRLLRNASYNVSTPSDHADESVRCGQRKGRFQMLSRTFPIELREYPPLSEVSHTHSKSSHTRMQHSES